MEYRLQSEIISWLKLNKVYVIKTKPGPGTPVGCPDVVGLYQDRWLAIEVKASASSTFQPGQKFTLQQMKEANSWVYVVYPENWDFVKKELALVFF